MISNSLNRLLFIVCLLVWRAGSPQNKDVSGEQVIGNVDFASVEPLWWELGVRYDGTLAEGVAAAARLAALDVHEDRLLLPDTTVIFVHALAEVIAGFVGRIPGAVVEIRKATGTIEPFLDRGAKGVGPQDWTADIANRMSHRLRMPTRSAHWILASQHSTRS